MDASMIALPALVVFDLDNCCWNPEVPQTRVRV